MCGCAQCVGVGYEFHSVLDHHVNQFLRCLYFLIIQDNRSWDEGKEVLLTFVCHVWRKVWGYFVI